MGTIKMPHYHYHDVLSSKIVVNNYQWGGDKVGRHEQFLSAKERDHKALCPSNGGSENKLSYFSGNYAC